jgi:O-antigen ligase
MMNFVKSTAMEQRVYLAKQQVMDWIDGNDTQSSVSIRMEMWKASIKQVNTHLPLTGVGYRNINPVIAKQADKKAQSQIARYNHVHNVYLNHLVSEGVFGLIAVLALLLFPLREFMSKVNSKKNDLDSISTMGMVLVVSLSLFGVTNHLFGDIFLNSFYIFFMAILLPKVARVN